MKTQTMLVNGKQFLVKIHYEDKESEKVSIGRNSINIRIPLSLSRQEQFLKLLEMKKWAENRILEKPEKFKQEEQKKIYQNGDKINIGNEEFTLIIETKDKNNSSAKIIGNTIYFQVSAKLSKEQQNKHVSVLLSRCIGRKRLPKLQEKILELNQKHFNQKIGKIFFKNTKSIWGSCSENNNINISTRLLFAPEEVLGYVCIHELAHLIEPNHSEKFWALVEKAMPEYKEKRNWLKKNENQCIF